MIKKFARNGFTYITITCIFWLWIYQTIVNLGPISPGITHSLSLAEWHTHTHTDIYIYNIYIHQCVKTNLKRNLNENKSILFENIRLIILFAKYHPFFTCHYVSIWIVYIICIVLQYNQNMFLARRSFRRRSKKTSKLRVTGLCAGNSPVTGEFPAQMTSNTENVSIWWRHHAFSIFIGAAVVFWEWCG